MSGSINKFLIFFPLPSSFIALFGYILAIIFFELKFFVLLIYLTILSIFFLINKNFRELVIFYLFFAISFLRIAYLNDNFFNLKKYSETYQTLNGKILENYKSNSNRLPYIIKIKIQDGLFNGYFLKIHSNKNNDYEIFDSIKVYQVKIPKLLNKKSIIKNNTLPDLFIKSYDSDLIKRPKLSFFKNCLVKKNKIFKSLSEKLSKKTFSLFCFLFLGINSYDQKLNANIKEAFNVWGISHYLARSGLHVILIILIWSLVLSLFRINFINKQIILIIFLVSYHILTYASISFLRALITFMIFQLTILNKRITNPLHLISLTCLITLIYNSFYLFALDFQLSYILTFSIAWFNEIKLLNKRSEVS